MCFLRQQKRTIQEFQLHVEDCWTSFLACWDAHGCSPPKTSLMSSNFECCQGCNLHVPRHMDLDVAFQGGRGVDIGDRFLSRVWR